MQILRHTLRQTLRQILQQILWQTLRQTLRQLCDNSAATSQQLCDKLCETLRPLMCSKLLDRKPNLGQKCERNQREQFATLCSQNPFLENPFTAVSKITSLVAQCSATPATVAATPPCSATPFQTQISVRHLPGMGGERCDTKMFRGVARHRCYTCKTLQNPGNQLRHV